jgi:hypothetical protein
MLPAQERLERTREYAVWAKLEPSFNEPGLGDIAAPLRLIYLNSTEWAKPFSTELKVHDKAKGIDVVVEGP